MQPLYVALAAAVTGLGAYFLANRQAAQKQQQQQGQTTVQVTGPYGQGQVTIPSTGTGAGNIPETKSGGGTSLAAAQAASTVPQALQGQILASVSKVMNSDGSMKQGISADNIKELTNLAGQLEYQGFTAAAQDLRSIAQRAGAQVAAPAQALPLPGMSADMKAAVTRALQVERDPKKLRQLQAALQAMPNAGNPEIMNAIQTIDAMATQLEAKQSESLALQEVSTILAPPPSPSVVVTPAAPPTTVTATGSGQVTVQPAPAPAPAPSPAPTAAPAPAALPSPAQAPSGPIVTAAANMVQNLWSVQKQYGSVAKAKGHENTSLVRDFQSKAGLSADGKLGPGGLVAAADKGGQYNLPLVHYWPRGATANDVLTYRSKLFAIADRLDAQGNSAGSSELRSSAAREKGQGGISGKAPA